MESELRRQLSRLAAAMRRDGARVGLGELLTAHRALAAVDASDRWQAHHALRAALCSGREDRAIFDDAFEEVFGSRRDEQPASAQMLSAAVGDVERAGEFMVVMEVEGYNVLPDRYFISRVEALCGRGAVRVID